MASSENVIVEFSRDPSRVVPVSLDRFTGNTHVPDYTDSEERSMMANLRELGHQGMSGIVHVIHRGTLTGESVYDSLPASLRKSSLYTPIHIAAPEDIKNIERHPLFHRQIGSGGNGMLIVVGEDGLIDQANAKKLRKALTNPVGILLGGGPGSATDKVYKPLLQFLEKPLAHGVPIAGLCLGHQELGHMIAAANGLGNGLDHKLSYELGTSVETITDSGKRQAVFSRFGDAVTVMHVNQDQVHLPEKLPQGVDVLSRSVSGRPSALLLDFSRSNQAITFQPHAEFQMRGRGKGYAKKPDHFILGGNEIIIPADTHIATRMLLSKYIGDPNNFKRLAQQYNLTESDVQNMLHPNRLVSHLGKRFFGPLVSWMAAYRLS